MAIVVFVLSILVIFTSITLYLTRTAEVTAACGDAKWILILTTMSLHIIQMPCVCLLLPIA